MKPVTLIAHLCLLATGMLFLTMASVAQTRHTVSGYLKDAETAEVLINAKIYDKRSAKGTLTNNYGFFSLTLPEGTVSLVAAYSGYQSLNRELELNADITLDLRLETYSVDEVEIVAENVDRIEERTEMSTIEIPVKQIKLLPALMGEVDVIKAVQLMPGVQSGSEGTTGLYVRGGGPDQNLILLDDVPLYYVSHLGGFFSVFNADAISSVKLVKGGFPARYAGRLSSVLDVRMKEGNMNKLQVEGSVGLIASKLSIQGPIVKGKTSFIISGRRTYLDLFTRPITQLATEENASIGYYFYDLNGKVNHIFSDKDRIYLSGYFGDDNFSARIREKEGEPGDIEYDEFGVKNKTLWGNKMGAMRWNHIWSPRLFSNLTATYTHYRFNVDNEVYEKYADGDTIAGFEGELGYQSGIRDYGAKLDFDFYPGPNHDIKFGVRTTLHRFTPGLLGVRFQEGTTINDTTLNDQKTESLETSVYIEDKLNIGKRFSANIGAHAVWYRVNQKDYFSIQPRISTRFLITDKLSFKASYVQMTQYLHLLANSGIGLPIDIWVPATDKVRPQESWQIAGGIASSLFGDKFELTIEGYYKRMDNLIEFREGTNFFLGFEDNDWQEQVETGGTGTAYGFEVLFQKKKGKTTGWIGYTLSWNNRQFENINQGKEYPYKYDRRHDLGIVISHELSKKIHLSAVYIYGTGNAITLPSGGYGTTVSPWNLGNDQPFQRWQASVNGFWGGGGAAQLYENGRNGFRMQSYHRLDLGVNFTKQTKWGERTWSVSIYNVYNRRNPYVYYFDQQFDRRTSESETVLKKLSLFPIIPSISYAFKF